MPKTINKQTAVKMMIGVSPPQLHRLVDFRKHPIGPLSVLLKVYAAPNALVPQISKFVALLLWSSMVEAPGCLAAARVDVYS